MLLATTGAILVTSVDRQILPAVLPAVMKQFHLTTSQGGLITSLSFFGVFLGALVLGGFGDVLGKADRRAWSWTITMAVATVASLATAFTNGLGAFALLRVIMGIGTGGMEPVNVALIADWWQKEDRGFAVGVHHTGFPIGQFVGPVLIGLVLAHGSWESSFLLVPLVAIPVVVLQNVVARKRNLERADAWMHANDLTPTVEPDQRLDRESPFKGMRDALRNRNVVLATIINFLFICGEAGTVTFLTLQLTRDAHLPLATAVVVSGASGLTGWMGQVVWGRVSDRIGRRVTLGILAVGWVVTMLSCIFIHNLTSAWLVLLGWGIVRNAGSPVLYALCLDSLPEGASSALGLTIGISFGLSGVVIPPISGWIIEHYGFAFNYVMLAALGGLSLVPITYLRETVRTRISTEVVPAT